MRLVTLTLLTLAVSAQAGTLAGGQVVDGKTTAPDEVRGRSIAGGTARRLVKGDLFIVHTTSPGGMTVAACTSQPGRRCIGFD